MHSASTGIRAVALLMVFCFSGTAASSQSVKFIHNADDPPPLGFMPSGNVPCTSESGGPIAVPYTVATTAGDTSALCNTAPAILPRVNPCDYARPGQWGCEAPKDLVQQDLAVLGKNGQKILRARERVLDILQTENACSEWMRQKDANPSATFRTLNFAVDRHGEEIVRVSRDKESRYIYRDPYVARVGQDTGAHATITLNAGGAFFQPQVLTLLVDKEQALTRISDPRLVSIGPYRGDSLSAQTLALLHEFGHVIDLLPVDFDNEDGKSMQNTAEVLRYCRADIQSKGHRGTMQAAK